MDIKAAIEEYSYAVSGLSGPTQRWYAYKLKYFSQWCEQHDYRLEDLKPPVIRRYITYLRNDYRQENGKSLADYTIRGYVQVVKGFLSWCSQEDGFDEYVTEKTVSRIEMPKVEQRLVVIFTPQEIEKLLFACDKEPSTQLIVRNRAIISTLLDTGARVSELFFDPSRSQHEHTGLLVEHTYLSPTDSHLKIMGKGRKEREVVLGSKARLYLHRYITRYRGRSESPYVFLSRTGEPLGARGAQQVLYRLGERAGVPDVHPHKFRHTFSVNYLLAGGDLFSLSRLMGHANISITQAYLTSYQSKQARRGKISVLGEMTRNDK